jgi:hypothetical protein
MAMIGRDRHRACRLRCVKQLSLLLQMVKTVLHQQRIENQPAIDAPMNDRFRRQFRLPLFNHETFALLTGHGYLLLVDMTA